MLLRTTLLALLVIFVGCNASYYRENLAAQLPRDDGSMLSVQCTSYVKHTVSYVSPELQPRPKVTVIMDERTFVVYSDKILLNGDQYAPLASDVQKVSIEITQDGFEVTADGQPVDKTTQPLGT